MTTFCFSVCLFVCLFVFFAFSLFFVSLLLLLLLFFRRVSIGCYLMPSYMLLSYAVIRVGVVASYTNSAILGCSDLIMTSKAYFSLIKVFSAFLLGK